MNPLMVTGSVLALTGIILLNARDYTGGRRLTWLIWLLLGGGTAALSFSGEGFVRTTVAALVAAVGGTLITVAFIAAKTGQSWGAVARQMIMHDKERRGKRS